MNREQYSKEQIADIQAREKRCLEFLKDNHMTPAMVVQAVNIGDDTFAMKPIPFLQDTRYTSSIQLTDL